MDPPGRRVHVQALPQSLRLQQGFEPVERPYLTVRLGAEDRRPPAAPGDLKVDAADLPAGEAWASWTTPADLGPAGTIGFVATVDGRPVPRDLIPMPGLVGATNRMHLRDLGLAAGASVRLAVRAVDRAGNVRLKVLDRVLSALVV